MAVYALWERVARVRFPASRMKQFQSEFSHSYRCYSFGYCNYAIREKGDKLSDLYSAGFVPFSAAPNVKDLFYMARSVRVVLSDWNLNSENRRVLKRFPELKRKVFPMKQFSKDDQRFLEFCETYFYKRHGKGIMPRERVKHILDTIVTHVIEYRLGSEGLVGYVFLVEDDELCHFLFSFYDLNYMNKSLGMHLMIDIVRYAQDSDKKFCYLGTAYGKRGIYKTNFEAIEFWNGSRWLRDSKALRKRCRGDKSRMVDLLDEWKMGWKAELFNKKR